MIYHRKSATFTLRAATVKKRVITANTDRSSNPKITHRIGSRIKLSTMTNRNRQRVR